MMPTSDTAEDSGADSDEHGTERRSPTRDEPAPSTALKRPRLADCVTPDSAGSGEWAEVISDLQPAIVALRVTCVRSFEEDPAATQQGTGFVVDRTRGLILTNRHVAGVGPVRAIAIFDRHEEQEVEVLYRDPVHDFGFFRYDPSKLRLTRGAEVHLDPAGLKVGTEIRVVGNDAGEKLQILAGTIARVDRNVPEFSTLYNDENTFYAGAGAGTSGGSSGSPVLNKEGHAIALNAAGQEGTASAFFLPLERVQYSLELLQAGQPVPRGTCMAAFLFKPFDELIRIGLLRRHEQETLSAHPGATGMLTVGSVLCEQQTLKAGDILLRLEGEVCIHFADLEAVLDTRVGGSVQMLICRAGVELEVQVLVANLHALIPRSFVELGLDILHSIGYHAAKRAHLPLDSGMYLARAGFVFDSAGCGRASLLCTVRKAKTPTPEALCEALASIQDRQYFPISWYELGEFRRDRNLRTGFAKMARGWSPLRLWTCSAQGASGGPERWTARDLPAPAAAAEVPPAAGLASTLTGGDRLVQRLQASLATLRFRTDRRFCTEANFRGCAEGVGLLVDAERGLVLTDRHSAPQSLGDVEVTLAGGAATVDGDVAFVHPLHNLAVVRCDQTALAALRHAKVVPLKAATIAQGAAASPRPGDELHFVGFDNQGNIFSSRVSVAAVYLPSGRDEFPLWDVPRFRERNLEILVLADTPEDARGGVLCDTNGAVRALFAAFDWPGPNREDSTEALGIPAAVFLDLVDSMQRRPDESLQVPSLDLEVTTVDVATLARGAAGSLPRAWLQAVGRNCGRQGQVARAMRVHRILPTGASDGSLQPGDVLLSIAGRTISSALDIETALLAQFNTAKPPTQHGVRKRPASHGVTAALTGQQSGYQVMVKVFRDGEELDVGIAPTLLGSEDDSRLVIWSGLVLRRTPRCILERCGPTVAHLASDVFVQNLLSGSPADARDLAPHCFLLELHGKPISTLDDVLAALCSQQEISRSSSSSSSSSVTLQQVPANQERSWARIRVVDLYGQEHVSALQCDPLFFPTLDLQRVDGGRWRCVQPGC